MYRCKLLYEIEFSDSEDFEEIGLVAWEQIGNKKTRLYKFIGHPDAEGKIELPCNYVEGLIEAVVAPHEDWNYTSNIKNLGDYNSEWIEQWIEHYKFERNPYYASGHYVHYNVVGNYMYLLEPAPVVMILYKGIELDDDDLPTLSESEINAIATFVAYVLTFKEARKTQNNTLYLLADKLERKWLIEQKIAKSPSGQLSLNDFDDIANAKSRWPGKVYGKSYKPLLK